jgi:hypothetical protein
MKRCISNTYIDTYYKESRETEQLRINNYELRFFFRILWKKSKPVEDVLCHVSPSFDAKNSAK